MFMEKKTTVIKVFCFPLILYCTPTTANNSLRNLLEMFYYTKAYIYIYNVYVLYII